MTQKRALSTDLFFGLKSSGVARGISVTVEDQLNI